MMEFLIKLSSKVGVLYRNILQKYFLLQLQKGGGERRLRAVLCTICAFTTLLFFQCGKKKSPELPADVKISITADKTTVTLPPEEGNHEVQITASGTNWGVEEEIDWLEATKVDNSLLKVSYKKNEGSERSGKVIATIEDESIEIIVTQLSAPIILTTTNYTLSNSSPQESVEINFGGSLQFGTEITHWWVTGAGGEAASEIEGVTSVSVNVSNRQVIATKTFTMNVTRNSSAEARVFSLELQVAKDASAASVSTMPFTVKQAGSLGSLTTTSYTISASAEENVTLIFSDLNLEEEAVEWWITGEDGAAIPTLTSASPSSNSKVATSSNSDTFTYSIALNSTGSVQEIDLELHIASSAGGPSLTEIPFTMTQSALLGTLRNDVYIISSSVDTDASLVLDLNLEEEAVEWWITGEDGAAIPTLTSASPSSNSKAATSSNSGTFTYSIAANTNTAQEIDLELHIASSVGGASLTEIPFTVTQGEALITTLTHDPFAVDNAASGSYDFMFTTLTLANTATHWWITGDVSLPEGVSLSPDKDDKKTTSTTAFTITLPRNETDQPQTYTLIFHVGGSSNPSDASLDVRSFVVTQAARLAEVSTTKLGPYSTIGETVSNLDLSSSTNGLGLMFENSAVEWWVTGEDGGVLPSGLTSVSPTGTRAAKGSTTLSFTLDPCTISGGCEYTLEMHVAASANGVGKDLIPFTITQGEALITTLMPVAFTVDNAASGSYDFTFTNLALSGNTTHWWIEGDDNLPENIGLSPDIRNKKTTSDPKTFTLTLPRNSTSDAQTYNLVLHAGKSANGSSLDVHNFTVTQPARLAHITSTTLGPYSVSSNTQTIDLSSTLGLTFASSAVEWWVTGEDGGVLPSGFTNVSPTSTKAAKNSPMLTFTLPTCDIVTTPEGCTYTLEIHVAASANGTVADQISFRILQRQALIATLSTTTYDLENAAAGTYTIDFLGLSFESKATHWWVAGEGTLPNGVSVAPGTGSKIAKANPKRFMITVPRNETTQDQTYRITLHAGTASTSNSPSLDQRTFKVTQPARLAEVGSTALGPYSANGGDFTIDLSNTTPGLPLAFEDAANHYWWISALDGSTNFTGLTSVDPLSTDKDLTNVHTLKFTLGKCGANTGCSYNLLLNIATSALGAAADQIPLTITQSKTLGTLGTTVHTIASGKMIEQNLILSDLSLNSGVYWWVTGDKGSNISTFTSMIPSHIRVSQTTNPNQLTYTIPANHTGTDRQIKLEIHIAAAIGTDPLTIIPFTITQQGETLGTLATKRDTISADGITNDTYTLVGMLNLNAGAYWWITGGNGGTITTLKSVTPANNSRRAHDGEMSFTYTTTDNTTNNDITIPLEIRIAKTATDDPLTIIPFTIVQSKELIKTLTTSTYDVGSASAGEYDIIFVGPSFEDDAKFWWVTSSNASVAPNATAKAATSLYNKSFTITLPRNKTDKIQDYEVVLHAGTSGDATAPSLHSEAFTVTQPARLASISPAAKLGPYDIGGYTVTDLDLSHATNGLDLAFESSAAEWWVTAENGNTTLPTGVSNVSPTTSRAAKGSTTLSFTLDPCTTDGGCSYNLEINVAKKSGPATDRLPFTIIQGESLIKTLTTSTYDVGSAADGEYDITFVGLSFEDAANFWWVTSSSDASVAPNTTAKASTSLSSKEFTITLPRNETDKIKNYEIVLHAGTSGGATDPSLHSKTFTVTQPARLASISLAAKLGPYDVGGYTATNLDLSHATNGLNLVFESSAVEWWVTAENGNTTLPTGVSNVSPTGTRAAKGSTTLSFTLDPCTTNGGCSYNLEINVAKKASDPATDRLPFTITQGESLIKTLTTSTYNVENASAGEYDITFVGLSFEDAANFWWVTSSSDASVAPNTTAKASTSLSSKEFTITLPRNETDKIKDYEVVLHAGTSGGDMDASLDRKTVVVKQAARLAHVISKPLLGPYASNEVEYSVDLGTDLGLTFEGGTNEWWVTGVNGGDLPAEMSVIQNDKNKEEVSSNDKTLTFTLPECTDKVNDCMYALEINVAETDGAAATDRIPFTITQSKTLGTLSTIVHTIASGKMMDQNLVLSDLSLNSGVYWWVTGDKGSDISTFTSMIPSHTRVSQTTNPNQLTYTNSYQSYRY